jgi:ribosome biogenesis GTPase
MPSGLIVKALSGFYYVLPDGEDTMSSIQCRARGIFKNRGESPLVGDRVKYELTDNGDGSVNELYSRSTELVRPPIANVDLAVLVFAVQEPALNLQLLDKFLVHTESSGLNTIICLTKQDLNADAPVKVISVEEEGKVPILDEKELPQTVDEVVRLYESIGYQVVVTSAKVGTGIETVMDRLKGCISVFAGQSGVGKSSLLNAMVPGLHLETNQISMKLGRGKHTTRHVELIRIPNGGLVADTPGFSSLDFAQVKEAEDLSSSFREFELYSGMCKFRGCVHLHEPECKVIEAKEQGLIAASRYKHYLHFLGEIKNRKRRY